MCVCLHVYRFVCVGLASCGVYGGDWEGAYDRLQKAARCVKIYICVYVCVWMCSCVSFFLCLCLCVFVPVFVCLFVWLVGWLVVSLCLFGWLVIYVWIYMCVRVFVSFVACVYVHLHIRVCVYMQSVCRVTCMEGTGRETPPIYTYQIHAHRVDKYIKYTYTQRMAGHPGMAVPPARHRHTHVHPPTHIKL
jgi:hypothetical protein